MTVNGEEFDVEIKFEQGKCEVTIEGEKYEVEIDGQVSNSPRKRRVSKKRGGVASGVVSSAIPGKIVSILVSEGDEVESGCVVIVLEAMKMQNEIKASIDGRVVRIMCNPGERIEANVPLMEISEYEKGEK